MGGVAVIPISRNEPNLLCGGGEHLMIAVGPPGDLHMYVDYHICFGHMAAIFEAHHTWET